MLIHPSAPQHYLVRSTDLSAPVTDSQLQDLLPAFEKVLKWVDEFICRPHPQLGREGAICPYVSTSIEKGLFWLTAYPGERPSIEEVFTLGITFRDWFLALEPLQGGDAQYKTILILFPDIQESDAPDIIDRAQIVLKPEYVNKCLMIGQFHALSYEPGAWNSAFLPMRSPIPLLVMRSMVPHDIPFLTKEERYVRAYLNTFGKRVPKRLQSIVKEAAHRYGLAYPLIDEDGIDAPCSVIVDQERQSRSISYPPHQEKITHERG